MKRLNKIAAALIALVLAGNSATVHAADTLGATSAPDFQISLDVLRTTIGGVKPGGPMPLLDNDNDGIPNVIDNCIDVVNTDQRDSDDDGYGNMCDADLDGSLVVNDIDLEIFAKAFFSGEPDADFNGDGVVNVIDMGILHVLYGQPPGPSGRVD